jgi:hypothetical protein
MPPYNFLRTHVNQSTANMFRVAGRLSSLAIENYRLWERAHTNEGDPKIPIPD